MRAKFCLVPVDGVKVADMAKYEDAIFETLTHVTDEHDEVILGDGWFSLSRVPTLNEILKIERGLAKLGLVIEA